MKLLTLVVGVSAVVFVLSILPRVADVFRTVADALAGGR